MATKTSVTAKKKTTSKSRISADAIRSRAEQIYHERMNNGKHGDELSDWLQAEKELRSVL
jgi:hypothetical protein